MYYSYFFLFIVHTILLRLKLQHGLAILLVANESNQCLTSIIDPHRLMSESLE